MRRTDLNVDVARRVLHLNKIKATSLTEKGLSKPEITKVRGQHTDTVKNETTTWDT